MATCSITKSKNSNENLVKLKIPFAQNGKEEILSSKTILVIDRSGSMAGGSWSQVRSAVKKIDELSQNSVNRPTIILYNTQATISTFEEVQKSISSGSTNFIHAFDKIQSVIQEIEHENRIVIIFMTDGCDTCNKPAEIQMAVENFSKFLKNSPVKSVVHAIGYSRDHDLKMLNNLKELGGSPGIYRYAEGSQGLDVKFNELFEFADATVELKIEIDGIFPSTKITGEIFDSFVEAEFWLDFNAKFDEKVLVELNNQLFQIDPIWLDEDLLFEIQILAKKTENISDENQLEQIQKKFSEAAMKINKLTKEKRTIGYELCANVQERLNLQHKIFADRARGIINETSALAKLNDLRYAEKFSKSSRQRRMDQRALKNKGNLTKIDEKLEKLSFDPEKDFLDIDLTFFTCCLTMNNCKEVMMDNPHDVMGVGLTVERQEHVVDAPTLIKVKNLSVTFLSKNSCEDAIRFKLDTINPELIHGGFLQSKWTPLSTSTNLDDSRSTENQSEFTRGFAAEPINAFLPLYICEKHFARVEVLIEPILGYLFTLDGSGFSSEQYLGLYSILGQILNLIPMEKSERHEKIIEEFSRLCKNFLGATRQYLGPENDLIENFCNSPLGRSKSKIQNLMTFFGFLYATENFPVTSKIRYAIIEELLRRHISYVFQGNNEILIEENLRILLYGNEEKFFGSLKTESRNSKSNDSRFAAFAEAKLKNNEKNIPTPSEQIEFESNLSEKKLSEFDETIRRKIDELLRPFSVSKLRNVFNRLGISWINFDDENEMKIVRSMFVQSLRFYRNESINSARFNENFFESQTESEKILLEAHKYFQQIDKQKENSRFEQLRAMELARRMALTSDLNVFLGRLMVYVPTRGGKVFDGFFSLIFDRTREKFPFLFEKIQIIFTGQFKQNPQAEKCFNVIADGIAWFPDSSIINRVKETLGNDDWDRLDQLMRGRVCGHVYRISDIPNRHGYHNSNPNPLLVYQWNPR